MRNLKPLINISYKQSIIFAAFLVFYELLTYVANDMIMPGMHIVVRTFSASESNIATSLTCFMLGGSSLQFIIGPVSDAYGRRKVMLTGVVIFLISTFLLTISQSMNAFLIERFTQGMGICFISSIGYATLQEIFNDTDAVKLTSIMSSISILAPLLGPLLGTVILIHSGWRMIFALITAGTIYSLFGLWKYMPETVGVTKINGEINPPQPLNFKKSLRNYQKLLSNKAFISLLCMYGLMAVPCMIWIALSPVMIIVHAHKSMYEYSLWQIPMFSAFVFATHLLQRLIDKFDIKKIMEVGVLIVILSLVMSVVSIYMFGANYLSLIPCMITYFFGYATAISSTYRKMYNLSNVPKGTTAALISLVSMFIQAFGIECANYLYHAENYYHLSWFLLSIGFGVLSLLKVSHYCTKMACTA